MRSKQILLAVALAALMLTLVFHNPWSRLQFFQSFGLGEWAYQHLTTVGDKVTIINDLYNPGGEQMVLAYGPHSGFGPFYGGQEMIWLISNKPFVLKATMQGFSPEGAVSLERLDDDTLVFNSREYPITLTFARTGPSSEDSTADHELICFFIRASRTAR